VKIFVNHPKHNEKEKKCPFKLFADIEKRKLNISKINTKTIIEIINFRFSNNNHIQWIKITNSSKNI